MLYYTIHHDNENDSFTVNGDTLEEVRERGYEEMAKRNWQEEDCWSEPAPAPNQP